MLFKLFKAGKAVDVAFLSDMWVSFNGGVVLALADGPQC